MTVAYDPAAPVAGLRAELDQLRDGLTADRTDLQLADTSARARELVELVERLDHDERPLPERRELQRIAATAFLADGLAAAWLRGRGRDRAREEVAS